MRLHLPQVPGLLVRDILHRQVIWLPPSLSSNFFAKCYTPLVVSRIYVRLVLIML